MNRYEKKYKKKKKKSPFIRNFLNKKKKKLIPFLFINYK